jgi:hypothetical protein
MRARAMPRCDCATVIEARFALAISATPIGSKMLDVRRGKLEGMRPATLIEAAIS